MRASRWPPQCRGRASGCRPQLHAGERRARVWVTARTSRSLTSRNAWFAAAGRGGAAFSRTGLAAQHAHDLLHPCRAGLWKGGDKHVAWFGSEPRAQCGRDDG
eukprot:6870312-Prymnesium_polylepis.1